MALVRLIAHTHHILTTSISRIASELSFPFFIFEFTGSSPLDRVALTLTIRYEPQGRQLKPDMLL